MSEPPREPPALLLEQLALAELDEGQASELRAELAREAAREPGRDRLAELEASNQAILADYPPERLAAEIRRRLERDQARAAKPRSWPPWMLAPILVAAGLLVWIVIEPGEQAQVATREHDGRAALIDDGQPEQTRIKGGVEPHLVIDRQTATGHERLGAGEGVRAGDLLQVSYVPAGRREGVIISIDGAGVVTLHHPIQADAKPSLVEGKEVPLASAYELDDAPSFERFLFITRDPLAASGGPVLISDILAAAERLASDPSLARSAPLPLAGQGWSQHSMLLPKAGSDAQDGAPQPTSAAGEAGP